MRPGKTVAALGIVAAITVVAAGCAQSTVPRDHFYRLIGSVEGSVAKPPIAGTIVVHRFLADGLVSERSLVYAAQASPQELHQYHYHFWADPPTRMIQERTVDALRGAGAGDLVVTPELRARADWALQGKIKRLEHLQGESPSVAVELEFALERERDGEVVWVRTYRIERAAVDDSVSAAARAMDEALGEIFGRMLAHLGAG